MINEFVNISCMKMSCCEIQWGSWGKVPPRDNGTSH